MYKYLISNEEKDLDIPQKYEVEEIVTHRFDQGKKEYDLL